MTTAQFSLCLLAGCLSLAPAGAPAQGSSPAAKNVDKASAYYHFSLGHLYAELAGAYGNKGEFLDRAIDNYRKAMEADPQAGFLTEELSELYIRSGRLREAVADAEAALRNDPDNINARRILARIYVRLIGDSRQQSISEEMLKKATEQFEKISVLDPADGEVWLTLGRLYKLSQNSIESEKAFRKALDLDPESEDALLGLAMVYSDLGDHARAAEVLHKVTGKDPNVRTLTFLADTYEKMNRPAEAAEHYRRALDLAPENDEIQRALAESLLAAGRSDDALKEFEQLAERNPKDYRAQLRISQIARERRQFAAARQALDRAKESAPDSLEILYHDVNLLESEGRAAEAVEAMKKILASTQKVSYSTGERSNRAIFLERLGLLYRSLERYDDAVGTFRELGELDSTAAPRVAAQIADTWRQAKEFRRALEAIEPAYGQHPDNGMVAVLRASVLADLGRADEAAATVEKYVRGKSDRESFITLAQIYEKTKGYARMARALDEAARLSQSDDEKATVLFMRGAMHERLKEFDQAEAAFRAVLRISPDNASAMNYLGYMFADRNVRLDEALQLIGKALEFEPDNGAYLDSLGWVYYRLQRYGEAEDYLRRAAGMVSRDPVVHDHLGDVYFAQGKLREAIAAWKLSVKEWETASASEDDPAQRAAVQSKLEGAEVRLARESPAAPAPKQP